LTTPKILGFIQSAERIPGSDKSPMPIPAMISPKINPVQSRRFRFLGFGLSGVVMVSFFYFSGRRSLCRKDLRPGLLDQGVSKSSGPVELP
jgi:hypothetical protein